jgi:hypothetical protein
MNNKTIANELNQNIDCNWRPDFQQEESWKKEGFVVVFVTIKTKKECEGLARGIDSAVAVKMFGAVDFSFDVFAGLRYIAEINFILYGSHNPVFFVSRAGVELSNSKAILDDDGYDDLNYGGNRWLKNAVKWLAPENNKDFDRSALLLNAYEEDDNNDGYVFFFSHNIENTVEFDVMSNVAGQGVFCKGVVFNVADLVTITDDKTSDLFEVSK